MSEHVSPDVWQLQEHTLSLPHLLHNHLTDLYDPFKHILTGDSRRLRTCEGEDPVISASNWWAGLTGAVLGVYPDLRENRHHLIHKSRT